MLEGLLLSTHAFATLALVGLILTIQVVHYPLMLRVPPDAWPAYETAHMRRITVLVAPLMLVELVCVVSIVALAAAPARLAWPSLALALANWVSTALIQSPLHVRLREGFDAALLRRLIATNWLRTIAWSARGVVALVMLAPRSA